MRSAEIIRKTNETDITASFAIDGSGKHEINTGIQFLDHMLEQLAKHSLMDIKIKVAGDLHIDDHHSTEDSGWVLGEAFKKALGEKRGIIRYGSCTLPMDETMSRVSVDLSGRPYLVWRVVLPSETLGTMQTELFREWFQAFSMGAGITTHVENFYGVNTHHIIESCYKALARAIKQAAEIDPRSSQEIPSTKGTLGGSL